jgi:hypothetical protein
MAQQVRKRFQKTVKYQTNNKETEDLSRGMIYRELGLRVVGSLNVDAGNNTLAKTKKGAELAVIKRLDIVANNTDVIRSVKGVDIFWMAYHLLGGSPEFSTEIGDGSTDDPSFDTYLKIPVWMPRAMRPIDTALDARRLSDLKVEITWGSHTDINDDATGFVTNPTVEIDSLESFGISGPFSQWRFYPIEKAITQTNAQFQIDIPVNYMYRGFMLNFTEDGVDTGAVLKNFKWKSGTTVFADVSGRRLQQEYQARNGLNSQIEFLRGNANKLEGYYMYDHVTDGFLSEAVDALGFSELQLELDVVAGANTKVTVYPMQIIPVRGSANNA